MIDRELLELAAKAVNGGSWHPLTHDTPNGAWNPLTDDGDALRLAVKLGVGLGIDMQNEFVTAYEPNPRAGFHEEDAHEADIYAATRRAIVRAAAALGKEMP